MASLLLQLLRTFLVSSFLIRRSAFTVSPFLHDESTEVNSAMMDTSSLVSSQLFTRHGRVDINAEHEIIFVLRMKDSGEEGLERILNQVSDPNSVHYGAYLSKDEVMKITSPTPESRSIVHAYLDRPTSATTSESRRTFRIVSESECGRYVTVRAAFVDIERVFNAEFYHYSFASASVPRMDNTPDIARSSAKTSESSSDTTTTVAAAAVARSVSYTIPKTLRNHLECVLHIVQSPLPPSASFPRRLPQQQQQQQQKPATAAVAYLPNGHTTPALLKAYYSVPSANTRDNNSSQCIYADSNNGYSPSDLSLFQSTFSVNKAASVKNIGRLNSSKFCGLSLKNCMEGNLDMQYMTAMAPFVPTTFWQYNSTLSGDFLLSWILEMSALSHPPLVVSISYTTTEVYLSKSYVKVFDTEAKKLSVRGVTILAASGDDGVAGVGARVGGTAQCSYSPVWPASSPYVTAVGATMGPEGGRPEITCQSNNGCGVTSGGGFSTLYPRPAWQNNAVSTYLTNKLAASQLPATGYNAIGRAYPDVSMIGNNYEVIVNGARVVVSGTSASTPVLAGMLSLINSARRNKGEPSLGWINPLLYQSNISSFFLTDITSGNNKCTGDSGVCCGVGFYATSGWDPVTGWGSIDFWAAKRTLVDRVYSNARNGSGIVYTSSAASTTGWSFSSPSRYLFPYSSSIFSGLTFFAYSVVIGFFVEYYYLSFL